MKRILSSLCGLGLGLSAGLGMRATADQPAAAAAVPEAKVAVPAPAVRRPVVQIAVLLDTSNSMDGLIDQAKTQLWKIVGEFAKSKRQGQAPELQVALYEYGKSALPQKDEFLRQIQPLTTDLDKISEELFKLTTNGGEEYCGAVIKAAVDNLKWSTVKGDLKLIFIAGNEPFNQGKVDYKEACKEAIAKGILVNTIHCGSASDGISTHWKDGADLADGKYMSINSDQKIEVVNAPQDAEINRLGGELNKTFVAFSGQKGKDGKERQEAVDKASAGQSPQALAQRNFAKSNAQYDAKGWCVISACRAGQIKIEDLKEEDLPEELKKMTKEQRKAFIDAKIKERETIEADIKKLTEAREKFVGEELKKRAANGEDTLDKAIIKTVREQASKQEYKFE